MEISEVRVKLMENSDDRLLAFCSITFDNCFVVRDLKIIEGASGPFVAMPSRKLTSHCPQCGSKNHLRAQYCNQCGAKLREDRAARDAEGRAKLYADIAHPINSSCREMIQQRVVAEYQAELERSRQPGYVSRYDEDFDDDFAPPPEAPAAASAAPPAEAASSAAAPEPPSRPEAPARPEAPSRAEPSVRRDPAAAEAPRRPHVLPAAVPPAPPGRGPHRPPSEAKTDARQGEDDAFGAGIF